MSAEYQTNLLKCEICGNYYKSITNTHLRDKHNITTERYKELYPNSIMIAESHRKKLQIWAKSEANRIHLMNVQEIAVNDPKRKPNLLKVIKSDTYRQKMSNIAKEYVHSHKDKYVCMFASVKGKNHIHYGKSNWQRWFEKYGEEIANEKLDDWKHKNKMPKGSRDTKIELYTKFILNKYNIHYLHQYSIGSFYVDFYIPLYNLVIEVDGDYWHANPIRYNSSDIIKYPGNRIVIAEDIWNADMQRQLNIEKLGYSVVRIFGSELTEDVILSHINKFDKDIVRTYGKP